MPCAGVRGRATRAAFVLALAASAPGAAVAGDGGYPVRIESEPPGATISIDEGEVLGTTPFRGKLPEGSHTLILQLDGYEAGVTVAEVRASDDPQTFEVELAEVAYGSIVVAPAEGGVSLEGAEVRVDGENVGTGPGTMKVPVGPHQIEIVKPGFRTHEAWIEVAEGQALPVTASLERDPDAPAPAAEVAEEPEPAPRSGQDARTPLVTAGGGVEFGVRAFRYDNPQTGNLRPYDAGGVPLLRVGVDVRPLAREGSELLAGLAILGRAARAVPLDSSTADGQVVDTVWDAFELGVRAEMPVTEVVRAGLEGGYGRRRFSFENAGALADEVPDVNYHYARAGAVGAADLGRYELRGAASYVVPFDAGKTADRFADASVSGLSVDASVGRRISRHFSARLMAHYTRFGYDLSSAPEDAYRADGGTDHFFGVTLAGFFLY